jgi:DNA-directed RNA polymerase subunit A'
LARVVFTVRTPEEIERLSAVEVTTSSVTASDGTAAVGGLRDPRFGPSAGRGCGTCHATCARPCVGHFGHYGPFAEPLYNIHFVKQVIVWLRLVCPACGEVQVDAVPPTQGVLGLTRWREKHCRVCHHALVQSLAWDRKTQVLVEKNGDALQASEALRRFRRVPDDHPLFAPDAQGARLPYPRALITSVLFVPSVCLRPCVGGTKKDQAPRGESDLTYRLVKIIQSDQLLRKKKQQHGADFVSLRAALLGLQDALTSYLDAGKSSKAVPGATDAQRRQKYTSASDLLRGKEGLFRGNLCGKRVDHASRGVICPFPGAHPTTLGVPQWIAEEMTVPETVTDYNRAHLSALCARHDAKYLERGGERVNLETHPDPGRLSVGDVVHRRLVDGDVVLFNRQPTLSKRSMLALRVKILPAPQGGGRLRVFRLPLQLTPGFNADFDGDEMNLHVPQTLEARAECQTLLGVAHSVINSSDGRASVVPVQGDRLGTYQLTDPGRTLTRSAWAFALGKCTDAMRARALARPPPTFPAPANRLWSLALPDAYHWQDGGVEIRDGVLVRGRVGKRVLLRLVKDIALDRSAGAALDFLHGVNLVCGVYCTHVAPTTIRFEEVCPSAGLTRACARAVRKAHARSRVPGADVARCVAEATAAVGARVRASRARVRHDGMRHVVDSGAKGNPTNAVQMTGVLGKMLSEVKGVFTSPESLPGSGRRCFSTSAGLDPFMDAFVPRGYAQGMTLQQYSVHATAGRSSLISSSQLVGKVGYMFRRLSAALESCSAAFGGSVVDISSDHVVSFRYGDDGRSPFAVEKERLRVPRAKHPTPALDAQLAAHLQGLEALFPDAGRRVFDVPVSVRRVLHAARHRPETPETQETPKTHETAAEMAARHAAYAGGAFLRHWLGVHLHPYALEDLSAPRRAWAVRDVDRRLYKSRVEDGEPVGHLCASSLSAAATQFTLNSFHNVGASGGSYAGLEETINLNKTRRAPLTRFRLLPHVTDPAAWVAEHKLVRLRDVVARRGAPRPEDAAALASYWELPDDDLPPFAPCTRLEVHYHDAFAVRVALHKAGVTRAAYARQPDGAVLFHTSVPVTPAALDAVVSGSIEGCRLDADRRTVCCTRLQNPLAYSDVVDGLTYATNNFHTTARTLGIEAARACMVQEVKRMLTTFNITNFQDRHILLLADRCTSSGVLLGATRHGIHKRDPSRIFHSGAFEQHTQVLAAAAAAGAVDALRGPQERQVLGQTARIGTRHPWLDVRDDPHAVPVPHGTGAGEPMDLDDELDFGGGWWRPTQAAAAAFAPAAPFAPQHYPALQQDPWSAFR